MTPQEMTTFITFTANIISKDMSSDELDRLAACFSYLSDTLYLISDLIDNQQNTNTFNGSNNLNNPNNINNPDNINNLIP